jgi:Zn-dependent hydrolases, including glyoxylases
MEGMKKTDKALYEAKQSGKSKVAVLKEVILSEHNEPLKKDAIDDTLNYLTFLRERVKKMKEEGKSIDEIRQALAENPFKDYKMYNEFYNANIFAVYNQLDYEED